VPPQENSAAPPIEAISFLNLRGLNIRGLLSAVSSEHLLILAHGFTSDKDAEGRFPRITALANRRGWSTLVFDFSGCGESDDAPITVEREIEDLRAAITFAQKRGYRKLSLLGNSLGARICLMCADANPITMMLIGGSLGAMHYNWEEYYTPDQLAELRSTGQMRIPSGRAGRSECVLEQQTLDDFASFDQDRLLSGLRCPLFLIYGDSGWEEQTLLTKAQQAFPRLPAGSRLEVIPGATHGCREQFDQVLMHLESWIRSIES
jgi:pimeloyl-ACP methyl ester carboxylesterase